MSPLKLTAAFFICIIAAITLYNFYPETKIPHGVTIDKIIVNKSKHEMVVFAGNEMVKKYTIAIGKIPKGKKEIEGDLKTPEGTYIISAKNPNSAYHKNLGVSYPNKEDITMAKSLGKPTGGDVKIHGCNNKQWYIGRFHRWTDWTNGCIAVTDDEIDDLFEHTPVGTPIIIQP